MTTPLDPIVSEFETQEQADEYDRWFHAKVEASLSNPGPGVPHDEVMARMDAIIAKAERRHRERARC
ncbi:type II toxin-antitoxin system RelB family antitoxin [Halomonas faecis]|uniref:type II toxin-antitoxin system RelB family antitoxin n=1 Tax=Halomonas faecis TaxID=1562110 RepID=UPI0013D29F6B|nr:stability determinant [Halomonas faecis]